LPRWICLAMADPTTPWRRSRASRAIRAVGDLVGPLRGVIAQSIGCAATGIALARGLEADRVVLIGSPARYWDRARVSADAAGLTTRQWQDVETALAELGAELIAVDSSKFAPLLRQPARLIHAENDRIVSIEDGRDTARAWPTSEFVSVGNLGHFRILQDAKVVRLAVEFMQGA
jgi:pimeloyl-ACP methyl ester carboxylesterase